VPRVLITGANRGIGLEFARQYAADGWRVIATCRDPKAAAGLQGLSGWIDVFPLEVTDFARVRALADELAGQAIDVLINNAGVYGPRETRAAEVDGEAWAHVLRVNTIAPFVVSECFMGHVAASTQNRIVAVSSSMGSIAKTRSADGYIYRSSKAALNMAMRCLSATAAERGVTVAMLHPGWVRTDMGGSGADIEPAASVDGMRRVIAALKPEDNGKFFNHDGTELPW
jgi:NAD(P)-dependent dehydrogenase (short-subunit alcohol dehydrogenase family)